MTERGDDLGETGQLDLTDPAVAGALLAWIGGLGNCLEHEELARRTALNPRTLGRFASGEAGRGGPETLERLLATVRLSYWVGRDVMLPVLQMMAATRQPGFQGGDEALLLAGRVGCLAVVALVGAEPDPAEPGIPPWALHPADARAYIACLQALADLTRRDLAGQAGISHEALRLYASGEKHFSTLLVPKLATGAGVRSSWAEGLMVPALRTVRRLIAHPRSAELATGGWRTAHPGIAPIGRPGPSLHVLPEKGEETE